LGPAYPGKIAEIGGRFVGPTQDQIYALIAELGLQTFPTYDKGLTTSVFHGHKGKHVIIAMPPALTGRIMHEPAVAALRNQLVQRLP
jgi:monoamine oxidase